MNNPKLFKIKSEKIQEGILAATRVHTTEVCAAQWGR